jgi:hypothetical protein
MKVKAYCHKCDRQTMHEREPINHILHLLLTVLTCHFWMWIWGLLWAHNVFMKPALCTKCGEPGPSNVGAFLGVCAACALGVLTMTGVSGFCCMNMVGRTTPAPAVPAVAQQKDNAPDPAPVVIAPKPSVKQDDFQKTVESFFDPYLQAPNELKKSALRADRSAAISALFPDWTPSGLVVKDWEGTLRHTFTTTDGKAVVKIELSLKTPRARKGFSLTRECITVSNTSSFLGEDLRLPNGSQLYKIVADLPEKSPVVFSGVFIKQDKNKLDFIRENSNTEKGSMLEPDFTIRYTDIRKKEANPNDAKDDNSNPKANEPAPKGEVAKKESRADFEKRMIGKTRAEVLAELGKPTSTKDKVTNAKGEKVTEWTYRKRNLTYDPIVERWDNTAIIEFAPDADRVQRVRIL